ncbi:MAG: YybH family protein [Nitrosospira sp.]
MTASDDMAFSHSLNHISGARTNGEKTGIWVRVTACYRKANGKWMITHEHVSMPFHMDGSNRAAVDLNPDNPLGGSASLRECWQSVCGHFRRLLGAHRPAMDFSQPTKRSRNLLRHHLTS